MSLTSRVARALSALLVAMAISSSLVGWTAHAAPPQAAAVTEARPASLAAFRREWVAHTRNVVVSGRRATETVSSGCCQRTIHIRYVLSQPRRTGDTTSVRARVRWASYDPAIRRKDRLYRGDVRRLRIRHRVLHTPFTFYCDADHYKPRCGA